MIWNASAANCTFNNVVKTTVLMADMKVNLFYFSYIANYHFWGCRAWTRPLIWACMPKRSPNRFSITALSRGWIICKGILSPFHKDYSNPCLLQAVLYVIFQMWQDYPAVNEVYAQFFTKEAAPARAAYQVNLITDLHGFPSFWSTTCTVQGVLHRSLYF